MRMLTKLLPHLTIALALVLIVVVIVDSYNPMMGFLRGKPFQILAILAAASSLATALCLLFRTAGSGKKSTGKYEKQ